MKLTYLSIDTSFIGAAFKMNDIHKEQLVTLFKQCATLQALELCSAPYTQYLYSLGTRYTDYGLYGLLSHFPSLEYCKLSGGKQPTVLQDILTTCRKLRYFYHCSLIPLSLSSAHITHSNLQQLCIIAGSTDLDDNFMDTVSAHGGLIHVFFFVNSVTSKGITILIRNSPDLSTVGIGEKRTHDSSYFYALNTSLRKKFANRRLFISGLLRFIRETDLLFVYVAGRKWLPDPLPLWPHVVYKYNKMFF